MKRLQIREVSAVTVLADGAKWIWGKARLNLTGALGVLDVYHALESINDTSKKLFGDGSPAATIWTDTLRTTLLERGGDGFDERGRTPATASLPTPRNGLDWKSCGTTSATTCPT